MTERARFVGCAAGTAGGWPSSTPVTSSSPSRPRAAKLAPTSRATSASSSTTRSRCGGPRAPRRRDPLGRGLDFRDPWGKLVQVVQYDEVQFAKTEPALRALDRAGLGKSEAAAEEIREKGLL
ncbi:MAG TPA: hypothetical protein VEB65_00960 [Solirubrobacterales bacterium]|nr:hypothetical protein [Solirubrobacterales bacterium]